MIFYELWYVSGIGHISSKTLSRYALILTRYCCLGKGLLSVFTTHLRSTPPMSTSACQFCLCLCCIPHSTHYQYNLERVKYIKKWKCNNYSCHVLRWKFDILVFWFLPIMIPCCIYYSASQISMYCLQFLLHVSFEVMSCYSSSSSLLNKQKITLRCDVWLMT